MGCTESNVGILVRAGHPLMVVCRMPLAFASPPEAAEALLRPRRGRPRLERPKIQFTARFDADIVEHFRNSGKSWQVKMEEALRKAIDMGL